MSAPARLRRQRADLIERYARARRRQTTPHATATALTRATTALLQAELREAQRSTRATAPRAAPPSRLDLFAEARA